MHEENTKQILDTENQEWWKKLWKTTLNKRVLRWKMNWATVGVLGCTLGQHSEVLGQQQQKPVHHNIFLRDDYLEMIIRTDAATSVTAERSVNIDQLGKVWRANTMKCFVGISRRILKWILWSAGSHCYVIMFSGERNMACCMFCILCSLLISFSRETKEPSIVYAIDENSLCVAGLRLFLQLPNHSQINCSSTTDIIDRKVFIKNMKKRQSLQLEAYVWRWSHSQLSRCYKSWREMDDFGFNVIWKKKIEGHIKWPSVFDAVLNFHDDMILIVNIETGSDVLQRTYHLHTSCTRDHELLLYPQEV